MAKGLRRGNMYRQVIHRIALSARPMPQIKIQYIHKLNQYNKDMSIYKIGTETKCLTYILAIQAKCEGKFLVLFITTILRFFAILALPEQG